MKSGVQEIWTLRESADLIGKYSQLQASVTSSLEIAVDTVLKQNMTLACNMLLARRDRLLKDCSSKLGPKDLANLCTGHFDQQEVSRIQRFCLKWRTTFFFFFFFFFVNSEIKGGDVRELKFTVVTSRTSTRGVGVN